MDDTRLDGTQELGARLAAARRRRGMTQGSVAQLVGRSEDWLRRIEAGQRGIAVRDLARVAEVLHANFAGLLGEVAPASFYTRPEHPALGQVRAALGGVPGAGPAPAGAGGALEQLRVDVASAWRLRSTSGRDRTDLAAVLPRLLSIAPAAAREALGDLAARREAQQLGAQVYHLAQLYLCYQDAPELLWVSVDRGMRAALDADDPLAVARGSWYAAYLYRDTGHVDQAHQVVDDARLVLDAASPQLQASPAGQRARAHLTLAGAINHGRDGARADAERWLDAGVAADAAATAGGAPLSPHALFGQDPGDVALSLEVELGRAAAAARRAEATDTDAVTSVPRRTRLLLEVARAQLMRREHTAAVAVLRDAYSAGPEATVYSMHGRAMVQELRRTAGPMLRGQVARLADAMGISA